MGAVVELWPSLNLLSLVVLGGKWLPFSQVGGIPMSEREPHWWHTNGVPNNMTKMQLPQIGWFILFSCQGLCANNKWPCPESQVTATNFMSMATKLSHLVDKMSGANLQMNGHAEAPSQSVKDPWEPEEEDSSPSHLPSWSPAQRLPSSCPNMKYCLEIWVTLTEEFGGHTPTLSFLDGPTIKRHAAWSKNWTHQSSGDWPR